MVTIQITLRADNETYITSTCNDNISETLYINLAKLKAIEYKNTKDTSSENIQIYGAFDHLNKTINIDYKFILE